MQPVYRASILLASAILLAGCDKATDQPPPVAGSAVVEKPVAQPPFQRSGVGRSLLAMAERRALERGEPFVWLSAWSGNTRALAFYAASGYRDVGVTQYVIEGTAYENRVLAKRTAQSRA